MLSMMLQAIASVPIQMLRIPPSTLKDRLRGQVAHGSKPGPKPYLSAAEEQELAGHLIDAANIGYRKNSWGSFNYC